VPLTRYARQPIAMERQLALDHPEPCYVLTAGTPWGGTLVRRRRDLSIIGSVMVLMTLLALAPAPAAGAVEFEGPLLAGRPIRDDGIGDQCRGLAYARVGGWISLLTAHHCPYGLGEQAGDVVYTNGNVRIGVWGTMDPTWTGNDLAYIILDWQFTPRTGANQVYRGEVPGNNWWNITTNPGPADGCAGFPAGGAFPDTTYHNYQATKTSTTAYRTGKVIAFVNGTGQQSATDPNMPGDTCNLQTDLAKHSGPDSGSPFIRYSDQTTVNGIASGHWNGKLYFNPLYEGLDDLNTYWVAQNGTGAWLCQTSTC
jgi:hypothetical protein